MKRFFKSFSIIVIFLFLGCEQEPNLSSENELDALDSSESQSHDWEYLSIEEIPEINQFLLEKTGKDLAVKNNQDDFGGAIFETEDILEVIDSLDNTNYSFAFSFPDTPEHIKYNLIVGKNPDGEISNPFVIKYTSEQGESFQNFQENGSIFPYFKGTVSVHRYTDFFKGQLFNKDCPPEHDQYGDPIPCIEESVGSGGSGGSSSGGGGSTGGTSSGGSSSGSGGGSGSCIQYYERCWCNGNLVGSHDHAPTRLVIDCGNINYLKGTYRSVDCPDCETSNGSIGVNFSSNVQKLKDLLRIPNSNTAILNKLQANDALALRIAKILTLDGNTPQAKTEAWMTLATELTDTKWTTSSGQFRGRSSLPYKAKRTISINGQNISQFLLENNDVISYGTYRLCTGCSESQDKTYYYSRPENLWYEYKVPPSPDTSGDLNYLMETIIWESSVFVARYVLPIEDVVILIDGKDFDGVEQSRVKTAGFLIVGLIPGGKVMKPITKIVSGVTKYRKIIKVGSKNISLPPISIVNGVVDFGSESYNRTKLREVLQLAIGDGKHAHHIIPWEFRNNILIQKAAKSDKVFHISEKLNGIPLPSSNHLTGHRIYSNKIQSIITTNANAINNMNPNEAYVFLNGLVAHIDDLIKANPGKNLGELANLISYP